jgi:general secretion pathway protein I
MAAFTLPMSNNKKSAGFTLIEVLVALAILSIALTAIIKFTSQNIRDTIYIQNKVIASWVGTQIINEIRAGVLKLPDAPEKLKQETEMLGQQWPWQASFVASPNPHIKEIHVDVLQKQGNGNLISLVSYVYVP